MKKLLTILFLAISINGFTQDIVGKWYMINRSGVIELKITMDSIITNSLSSDLTSKGRKVESKRYKSIVHLDNKTLLIAKDRRDTTKYLATVMFDFKKESFQMAWNVSDTALTDIKSLIEIHKADKNQLFGYTVFNEKYLPSLSQMKDIDQMTLEDFKKYAKVYAAKIQLTRSEFNKYNIGYAAITYNFQLIIQSLFDSGFNPIENASTIDAVYKKYYNDPEVKEILENVKLK